MRRGRSAADQWSALRELRAADSRPYGKTGESGELEHGMREEKRRAADSRPYGKTGESNPVCRAWPPLKGEVDQCAHWDGGVVARLPEHTPPFGKGGYAGSQPSTRARRKP